MRKEARQKEVKLRKNFFLTLFITLLSWGSLTAIIFFVDPFSFGAIPLFFLITFISLFLTVSTILASSRQGAVLSVSILVFLILRYLGVGNILNLILITGLVVAVEIFLLKKS